MNGAGHVSDFSLGIVATTQTMAAAADFNADGHPDIVWSNLSSGDRLVWFMAGSTAQISAFVARTPETFGYDLDGNLISDGRWSYAYDAENRLIAQETLPAAITAGVTRQKLTYTYDYLNRRVGKLVQSGWNGTTYSTTDLSRHYVYQGWNLIAELDRTSGNRIYSYYWGLDLSGTTQGAGGTGGLLLTLDSTNAYLPINDSLGNIHGLIKAADGTMAAAYEYDAFGNTVRESGSFAASNPFRYSTKYTDVETGLIYYGQRFYSPSLGRFVNRDPIEESGGLNLYGFCSNNGVNGYDLLGMDTTIYNTTDYWGNAVPVWTKEARDNSFALWSRYGNAHTDFWGFGSGHENSGPEPWIHFTGPSVTKKYTYEGVDYYVTNDPNSVPSGVDILYNGSAGQALGSAAAPKLTAAVNGASGAVVQVKGTTVDGDGYSIILHDFDVLEYDPHTNDDGPGYFDVLSSDYHGWAEQMGEEMEMPQNVRTLINRGVPLVAAARDRAGATQREFGSVGFITVEHGPELTYVRQSLRDDNFEYSYVIGFVKYVGGNPRVLIHAHPAPYYTPSSIADQNIARGLMSDGQHRNDEDVGGGIWVVTIRNGYIEIINPTGHINKETIGTTKN